MKSPLRDFLKNMTGRNENGKMKGEFLSVQHLNSFLKFANASSPEKSETNINQQRCHKISLADHQKYNDNGITTKFNRPP